MKVRFALILASIFFFLVSNLAFAHGTKFFEFAPDPWQSKRYVVSTGPSPYLLFQPSSNFSMTGFDLWADNTGDSGQVIVTLADPDGTIIASKSKMLPELPAIPGGNRFHIDWATPVTLSSAVTYSIEIESTLLGFGLYYGDRFAFLEHNRDYVSPYENGAARIGGDLQPFTFKFALYEPRVVNNNSSAPPPSEEEIRQAAPESISISNARIVAISDTAVLFAWTTNIASDSRVSTRTQLNPLYVTATGYDATFELEHAVVVQGLHPSVNYFADVFSSTGSELTLTTYTIGFKTASAVQVQAQPNQNPQLAEQITIQKIQQEQAQQNQAQQTVNQASINQQNQSSSNQQGQQGSQAQQQNVSVTPGTNNGSVNVEWPTKATEPSNGYRIDVFGYDYNLEKQVVVPAGQHTRTLTGLTSGEHHTIVYANASGTFMKVAPAQNFTLTSNAGSIVNKIILVSLLWIASLGGYLYWKNRGAKTTLPPETGYTNS